MPSLDETFDALMEHLRHPESLNPAKSDPFFYFVHDPSDALALKQKIGVWSSGRQHDRPQFGQSAFPMRVLWSVPSPSLL